MPYVSTAGAENLRGCGSSPSRTHEQGLFLTTISSRHSKWSLLVLGGDLTATLCPQLKLRVSVNQTLKGAKM